MTQKRRNEIGTGINFTEDDAIGGVCGWIYHFIKILDNWK